MRCYTFGAESVLAATLEDRGWERIGHGYEMVRADLDDIPDVPLPDGLVVRPIGLDEASKAYALGHRWEYFRSMLVGFLGLPVPNSERIGPDERTRKRVQAWIS